MAPYRKEVVHVGLVNDHHDIVPFIHSLLRAKLLTRGCTVVHFDSHADLCVPSTKNRGVQSWLSPRSLYYDVLGESEAAISEFMIPMMYQGSVGPLIWIKSPLAKGSIEDGLYDFAVGDRIAEVTSARDAVIPAVNLSIPYYLDEGAATQGELEHARRVRFQVTSGVDGLIRDLPSLGKLHDPPSGSTDSSKVRGMDGEAEEELRPWVLDICLDYFSVISPFRAAIVKSLHADLSPSTSSYSPRSSQHQAGGDKEEHEGDRKGDKAEEATTDTHCVGTSEEVLQATQLMLSCLAFRHKDALTLAAAAATATATATADEAAGIIWDRAEAMALLERILIGAAADRDRGVETFLRLFPDEPRAQAAARRFFCSVLPALGACTRRLLVQAGLCLLLPHHPSSPQEVRGALATFKQALQTLSAQCNLAGLRPVPAAVTIARSVDEQAFASVVNPGPGNTTHGAGTRPLSVTAARSVDEQAFASDCREAGVQKQEELPVKRPRHEAEQGQGGEEEDGFTPAAQVETIQEGVLGVLRSLLGPGGAWGAHVTLREHRLYPSPEDEDEDEADAFERAYGLFLNAGARAALSGQKDKAV